MSGIEIVVILFGLFLGYWVVSKLMPGSRPQVSSSKPEEEPKSKTETQHQASPASWHEILDISPHATVDEIRRAYKVLMSQYHPDKVASLGAELKVLAEKKSKEITSAYRIAMQQRGIAP